MASNIMRFINWLRISDQQFTPVAVVGRAHPVHHGRSAVALAEPTTTTKTDDVVNLLVTEGHIPSTAADAAQAFYTVHQRKATRDEIHTIFVTLDSLGFIAD
ncbi:hypothetical protein ACGE24_07760 [Corynebacterium kroppenstedtii]|uniref:hypothetical protein n=1 Tax=Corynebacterium sp. PCR 32 TaxID=3351342 RepID=UPI0030B6D82E